MANTKNIHKDIKRQIDTFNDLIPVGLHSMWGVRDSQFIQNRMLHAGVIDNPGYWYSPSAQHQIGLWKFNETTKLPADDAVQETTLLTLLDDVTAELATRLIAILNDQKTQLGFTVNLKITKTSVSPTARLFYFDSYAVKLSIRKAVIECPLFDAESGKQLLFARATFVFILMGNVPKLLQSTEIAKASRIDIPSPLLVESDAKELDTTALRNLSQVMNILPYGLVNHKSGSFSTNKKHIVVVVDFNENLSGPPNHIHGGILATVMFNTSALLLSIITGIRNSADCATVRDVNYHKGMPSECKDVVVDAIIEKITADKAIIFTKLMRGKNVHTTLRTTFTVPSLASKL
ncbi:hypothetical protein GGI26_004752 [Coemansia sp. RSA 1358]|uniref:Thioesterase domain-containing protein n=1 Tax=Coemansia umbellata TaxID=1424467 RepID=A0ABQ8PIW6_9FUNG|nr:hypothetical protein EDC05_004204 [Coemansia umbellata]KAJ2620674.1 hypothetical protein GGI26_004752 [Coemansia sp. RSA 1358]